ncbi:hypothetical protein NC651_040242 [Populus alba x Populus x berolinensis]|nr:hypothetical protein NC651_040242 [Populus alba x Populus x berolinensis]
MNHPCLTHFWHRLKSGFSLISPWPNQSPSPHIYPYTTVSNTISTTIGTDPEPFLDTCLPVEPRVSCTPLSCLLEESPLKKVCYLPKTQNSKIHYHNRTPPPPIILNLLHSSATTHPQDLHPFVKT